MGYRVAVVGATGNVGREMLNILEELEFPVDEIHAIASRKSIGVDVGWKDGIIACEDIEQFDFSRVDLVLMSVSGAFSKEWSPRIGRASPLVIDNSSAWRMASDVPLVVAEVNPRAIADRPRGIIANPNCTTMAAMPVLGPLHAEAGLEAIVVATYQAVSGSGRDAVAELNEQVLKVADRATALTFSGSAVEFPQPVKFARPVAFNVLPLAGSVSTDGSNETEEEQKLRNESRKILGIPDLLVSATCVRVPVYTGHSLQVNARFARPLTVKRASEVLARAPGVALCDVPTPIQAAGADPTFVGRIRRDETMPNSLAMFMSSDNLRKGAALNAVQLAELLIS